MAKTDNLTDFLTGVANAIRTKKGTTAKINPQNFETEIGSITTSKPEQEKTAAATNSKQIVSPDSGKVLSKVIIEAIPLPSINNDRYANVNKCLIDKLSKGLVLGCNDSVIPSDGGVTSIGDSAFYDCSGLTSVTIPDSVKDIGGTAFASCRGLTSVTMLPTTPPTLGSNAIPSNVTTITVPVGCGGAYKAAEGWSAYASKIVEATA